jgi:hypothetical protein
MDRLHHAAPAAQRLFIEIAQRGGNLGSVTSGLLRLLDLHGAVALDDALVEALDHGAPHIAGVRQVLDRKRHQRGLPPAVPVRLPDDPRLRDVVVRPHSLHEYETIQEVTHARNQEDPAESGS